jgi:diaminopimelate epimerase
MQNIEIKFTKMHGCGNDYIYINCLDKQAREQIEPHITELSISLSRYHFGIGSDGVILILPPSDGVQADFRMRMFNADGSEGKMCGNASRCVGKYVYDNGLTDKTAIELETMSGVKALWLTPLAETGKISHVSVDMGFPVLEPKLIPVKSDKEKLINEKIGNLPYPVTCVSMGNPHAVIFLDDNENLETFDVEGIGKQYEKSEYFPEGVNVEFVKVKDKSNVQMRVWERGSGETMACGTGACAVAVAACLNNLCDSGKLIHVHFVKSGEELVINHSERYVSMQGSAVHVFDGVINVEV